MLKSIDLQLGFRTDPKYLYQLAEFVLPSDVLHYFSIVKIESDSSSLRIYLDEKMEKERLR